MRKRAFVSDVHMSPGWSLGGRWKCCAKNIAPSARENRFLTNERKK